MRSIPTHAYAVYPFLLPSTPLFFLLHTICPSVIILVSLNISMSYVIHVAHISVQGALFSVHLGRPESHG